MNRPVHITHECLQYNNNIYSKLVMLLRQTKAFRFFFFFFVEPCECIFYSHICVNSSEYVWLSFITSRVFVCEQESSRFVLWKTCKSTAAQFLLPSFSFLYSWRLFSPFAFSSIFIHLQYSV